jgi:hypothetical protein
MQIDEREYVPVEEHYKRPDAEYPDGSWMHKIGGEVTIATGYYAKLHPGKPSPYFHGGPPFVMMDTRGWPTRTPEKETEK